MTEDERITAMLRIFADTCCIKPREIADDRVVTVEKTGTEWRRAMKHLLWQADRTNHLTLAVREALTDPGAI